jgi:serine/threonine protein kinase
LSIEQTTSIVRQVLNGLGDIHSKQIVHRDLKPENIFIQTDGTIKIVDFGLSKLIDFSSITMTGTSIGSPLYMSPEQLNDNKNIDYRSDYYALGVIIFELLTQRTPYGEITSREELFYKIIHEKPLSIHQYLPTIPNRIDNLLYVLLEKSNFNRPNSIQDILTYLDLSRDSTQSIKEIVSPVFYLRVYNEKSVLEQFQSDGNEIEKCIYPINHKFKQKGLLKNIQEHSSDLIIEPATMRLAYDTFADVKGLTSLPYAPHSYSKLEISDLSAIEQKKSYVKSVIDEQLKLDPDELIAPFHMSNNVNFISIKNDTTENWFSLDVKLLKETKEYIENAKVELPLIGGFSIKQDILTSSEERDYFINVLSGLPCDKYLIYVDCIDYQSNSAQLYNYIKTLYQLQNASNKPVIAGRVGSIGLILAAFGIHGFEAGASRFESFYEGLYSEKSEPYNMYVMYYIPELMKNIAVKRKEPSRIFDLLQTEISDHINCSCPYCTNKEPDELVVDKNTKLHFLYRRNEEISFMRSLDIPKRLDFIQERIINAQKYYKALKPIFKSDDYAFLSSWQTVVQDLREELRL